MLVVSSKFTAHVVAQVYNAVCTFEVTVGRGICFLDIKRTFEVYTNTSKGLPVFKFKFG